MAKRRNGTILPFRVLNMPAIQPLQNRNLCCVTKVLKYLKQYSENVHSCSLGFKKLVICCILNSKIPSRYTVGRKIPKVWTKGSPSYGNIHLRCSFGIFYSLIWNNLKKLMLKWKHFEHLAIFSSVAEASRK